MTEIVNAPCTVEAEAGSVILECGAAAATLNSDVADQAGVALQLQAKIARETPPRDLPD